MPAAEWAWFELAESVGGEPSVEAGAQKDEGDPRGEDGGEAGGVRNPVVGETAFEVRLTVVVVLEVCADDLVYIVFDGGGLEGGQGSRDPGKDGVVGGLLE